MTTALGTDKTAFNRMVATAKYRTTPELVVFSRQSLGVGVPEAMRAASSAPLAG
ncbi:hypothetical protein AB0H00_29930 [Nocardia sp. NPDC023852]|uniref:hypothetical protein n=1 Tax=Nocardia sp. NPDC023852 TaxID=3154697 RepID=UPI0033F59CC3